MRGKRRRERNRILEEGVVGWRRQGMKEGERDSPQEERGEGEKAKADRNRKENEKQRLSIEFKGRGLGEFLFRKKRNQANWTSEAPPWKLNP